MTSATSRSRTDKRLSTVLGTSIAVLAGAVVPVQSRINGELAAQMSDGAGAAVVSFGGGLALLVLGAVTLPTMRRGLRRLRDHVRAGTLPRWALLGGSGGAMLVLSQSTTVGTLGVALFTVSVVAGQTISGLLVDRTDLAPGGRRRVTAPRLLGAALILVAVAWSVLAPSTAQPGWTSAATLLALVPLAAGTLIAFQQAVNGKVSAAAETPLVATAVNFAVGTAVLVPIWVVTVAVRGLPEALPTQWWLYLGGPLGIVFICAAAFLVRHIGVLVLGLGTVAGQLIGSLLVDLVVPTADAELQLSTVVGIVLTLIGVAIATASDRRPAGT